jgi:single-strand DNA-binding protein
MISVNRVILTGRIVKPPQRSFRPDGTPVTQFFLELNHEAESPSQSSRSLIDVVVLGNPKGLRLDHLESGQRLLVEGRLKQRRWRTPEGKDRDHMEVIATTLRPAEAASESERGENK